ncbi:4228_t:CDS:2 [Acaulospora colombiana]|uniref:4228_t:CDS:1 n=1 Tax=Acaulospora colombiana TaxID=27376 RepID=A0ACA9NMJ4_9GLOM|nr:4228_t:CDS:2 [Acaulospora colombiana]
MPQFDDGINVLEEEINNNENNNPTGIIGTMNGLWMNVNTMEYFLRPALFGT